MYIDTRRGMFVVSEKSVDELKSDGYSYYCSEVNISDGVKYVIFTNSLKQKAVAVRAEEQDM